MNLHDIYFREHSECIINKSTLNKKVFDSFISADYYSLANSQNIKNKTIKAIEKYGTSLQVGQFSDRVILTRQLEDLLSAISGKERACLFSSCYTANMGVISVLSKQSDLFIYDQNSHNSLISSIKKSKTSHTRFKHNDMQDLEEKLNSAPNKIITVVVEGLYSSDGDYVDLIALKSLKDKFKFNLLIDEAHSYVISENQKNIADIFQLDSGFIDIITGSLSKALGSSGGYAVSTTKLITAIELSNAYIFSTGSTPASIASAIACLEELEINSLHEKLQENIHHFKALCNKNNINLGNSETNSPIFTVIPSGKKDALALYKYLLEKQVLVLPLVYPAVSKGNEKLRVMINRSHSKAQLNNLVSLLS